MNVEFLAKVARVGVWLCIVQACLFGDHLPSLKMARGKPEHIVAGINVYTDKIDRVIQRLGKPHRYTDNPGPDGPPGSGERSYEWVRDGVRLRVGTEYYTDPVEKRIIESVPLIVDIWGVAKGQLIGRTGSGLSLGANVAKLKRIYGPRFQRNNYSVTLQWKDETTLIVDFDEKGLIDHMQLMAAVE